MSTPEYETQKRLVGVYRFHGIVRQLTHLLLSIELITPLRANYLNQPMTLMIILSLVTKYNRRTFSIGMTL